MSTRSKEPLLPEGKKISWQIMPSEMCRIVTFYCCPESQDSSHAPASLKQWECRHWYCTSIIHKLPEAQTSCNEAITIRLALLFDACAVAIDLGYIMNPEKRCKELTLLFPKNSAHFLNSIWEGESKKEKR